MRLFTSESVTPGHPDKVCDQISDAILDEYLQQDPDAHVAVEVFASAAGIVIGGEVSSPDRLPHARIARQVLRDIGYTSEFSLDPDMYPIADVVTAQSAEIAAGVGESLEARDYAAFDQDDWQGAGDQGLMFGYATNETTDLMPLPIAVAHDLAHRLTQARAQHPRLLGPDGKTQVTVQYDGHRPAAIDRVLVSTQHAATMSREAVEALVRDEVVEPTLADWRFDINTRHTQTLVNPSGSFVVGGPAADAGLTGRKIIVDTYGGMARHGGGAFSGKDPSKVDRSAAYAMRWVAKNVVAAGLAARCEVQVSYAIGRAHPVGLYVETFGTATVEERAIEAAVQQVFDLRPAAIIRDLDLKRPIYRGTATFGHFGGDMRPWERLDRVQALRAVVGVTEPARVGA